MSNSNLAILDAAIHGAMAGAGIADTGTYTPPAGTPVTCRVYVDRAVQQMGDYGPVAGPRTIVGLLRADVPAPHAGGIVAVGTEQWELESEIARDESVTRWVVGNGV